jgi:hypothetical protein
MRLTVGLYTGLVLASWQAAVPGAAFKEEGRSAACRTTVVNILGSLHTKSRGEVDLGWSHADWFAQNVAN